MKSAKDFFLIMASILFTMVLGAAVYEHLSIIPSWSAAPPKSLAMFQGEYGITPQYFWIPIHPVAILFFAGALIANWNTARKKNILTVLIVYVVILLTTYIYFVPTLLEIIETPYQDSMDQALTDKAGTWEMLSIIRLLFIAVMSYMLISTLTISNAITREVAP